MIPKAELHVHLEGTAPPELMRRIARRNGLELPEQTIRADGSYAWSDFLDFLRVYDQVAGVIRTAEDYRDITYEYLIGCAAEGAIYVELTASPDHAAAVGLTDREHVTGIAQGIDDARAECGIEARIVMICVRHLGVEGALDVARRVVAEPHPYVTGFGMAGDEAGYPPSPFAPAYAIAAEAGLGLTVHAGEWAGPESVRGGLELGVTRISHGVRAIEDPGLVAELAERAVVLECCPSSNVALGVYPDLPSHPLPALREAGVRVTLGSDGPPWWGSTIGGEYELGQRVFGFDEAALRGVTRTAIKAAFCDAKLKETLMERV